MAAGRRDHNHFVAEAKRVTGSLPGGASRRPFVQDETCMAAVRAAAPGWASGTTCARRWAWPTVRLAWVTETRPFPERNGFKDSARFVEARG